MRDHETVAGLLALVAGLAGVTSAALDLAKAALELRRAGQDAGARRPRRSRLRRRPARSVGGPDHVGTKGPGW